jgi:hypothetical protein
MFTLEKQTVFIFFRRLAKKKKKVGRERRKGKIIEKMKYLFASAFILVVAMAALGEGLAVSGSECRVARTPSAKPFLTGPTPKVPLQKVPSSLVSPSKRDIEERVVSIVFALAREEHWCVFGR